MDDVDRIGLLGAAAIDILGIGVVGASLKVNETDSPVILEDRLLGDELSVTIEVDG